MVLSILICEDSSSQRKSIEKIISDYIKSKKYDCEIVLSTEDPETLLAHIEEFSPQNNFYVLDVNLQHEINGIILGQKIREIDPFGAIIFVTSHTQLAVLTFRYKVEAMDYITKDGTQNLSEKICDCIDVAYRRHQNTTEYFQIKSINGIKNISIDSILFFESYGIPHKVVLHTKNEQIEFRAKLKDLEQLQPFFFKSHKSFVVNVNNIETINTKNNEIIMKNGEIALITPKKISKLRQMLRQ